MTMSIFEKNIINLLGTEGRIWLNRLPEVIDILADQWTLTALLPVSNMSWNYVATGTRNGDQPVVLKIGPTLRGSLAEYAALKHFGGQGAIHVLDLDKKYHALLLERARPGLLLKDCNRMLLAEKMDCYASVVRKLAQRHLHKGYDFEHVRYWLRVIDQLSDAHFENAWIIKAKKLRNALLNAMDTQYLCHGDLHLENIIQHQSQWLAIDPKGIVGDRAFEAAAFDLIDKNDAYLLQDDCTKILAERANLLAQKLEIEQDKLFGWIFLRIILSAQWLIEDNGNPDWMLTLARYFYPLLG